MLTDSRQPKISRRTLGKQVQEALRADILFGRIPGGTVLTQEMVCERFGVSRIPARDALANLAFEGFAYRDRSGSVIATALTGDELADVLQAEAKLHGIATRRATERATPEQVAALENLHAAMGEAMGEGEADLFSQRNARFHRLINTIADAPKLNAALRAITLHIDRHFLDERPDWRPRSHAEHARILELIKNAECSAVEQAMYDHVWDSGLEMIRTLPLYQAQTAPGSAGISK